MIDHLRGRLSCGGEDFGVAGVGPESAVAILSVMGIAGVLSACAREDAAPFTRVPGIGKKLAQRVALELPDRLKKGTVEYTPAPAGGGIAGASAPAGGAHEA